MVKNNFKKTVQKIVGTMALSSMIFSMWGFSEAKAYTDIRVYNGENRQETSTLVSESAYLDGVDTIVLASGLDFPDALTSAPLLKKENAPILLNNNPHKLDEVVNLEINRLKPKKVILVGGQVRLSSNIENTLKSKGIKAIRLAGANRYETSKKVQDYLNPNKDNINQVVVATGLNFPDALSISSYAAQNELPIIITDKDGNIALRDLKDYPNVKRVIIVGGEDVVSKNVDRNVKGVLRLAGSNRYETNKAINKAFYQGEKKVFVTTGEAFPDALSGATLYKNGGAVVLVKDKLSQANLPNDVSVSILGGRVLNDKTVDNINPNKQGRVTIFVNPHQDDETLFMGKALIDHYRHGNEMYLLHQTQGDMSLAIKLINKRLEEENKKPLDLRGFIKARDNDLLAAVSHVGIKGDKAVLLNRKQYTITPETVAKDIENFIKENNLDSKDITLVAVHEPADGIFHKSVEDHLATTYGAKAVADKHGYGLELWRAVRKKDYPDSFKYVLEGQDAKLYDKMLDEYNLWNPEKERYSTGYISVKGLFDDRRETKAFFRFQ